MPCQMTAVPRQRYSELDRAARPHPQPLLSAQNKSRVPTMYADRETIALIKTPVKLFSEISGLGSDQISPLKSGFNQLRSLLAYYHFSINPLNTL